MIVVPIKPIDLPETAKFVAKLVDSARAHRQETVSDHASVILGYTEAARVAVKSLDDHAMYLLGRFADPRVVNDKTAREELAADTNKYLTERKIVPELERASGAIEQLATGGLPGGLKRHELANDLIGLHHALKGYHDSLGEGRTGTWYFNLKHLYDMSLKVPKGESTCENLRTFAQRALEAASFHLTGRINELVGAIEAKARPLVGGNPGNPKHATEDA
jgi:hypothetical protein